VHCLAGAGRTGSVILYLLMRDSYLLVSNIKTQDNKYIKELSERMAKYYFGYNNIPQFIEKKLFSYFTVVKDEVLSDNKDFIKHMISELFELGGKAGDEVRISLFRRRLNYIIVFLAKEFNIHEFISYRGNDSENKDYKSVSTKVIPDTDTYIENTNYPKVVSAFSKPFKVKIENWGNYNINDILKTENTDNNRLYDEIMSWID
jgi:hypothetical protein